MATQRLTSGKRNKLINLFVGQFERAWALGLYDRDDKLFPGRSQVVLLYELNPIEDKFTDAFSALSGQ